MKGILQLMFVPAEKCDQSHVKLTNLENGNSEQRLYSNQWIIELELYFIMTPCNFFVTLHNNYIAACAKFHLTNLKAEAYQYELPNIFYP